MFDARIILHLCLYCFHNAPHILIYSTVFWLFVKPEVSSADAGITPTSDYEEGALYPEAVRSGRAERSPLLKVSSNSKFRYLQGIPLHQCG